ncbi:hypothetical protein LX36DRAFT_660944 [Colletotrichum falcatum]|nr:hypothetical protein LX36DRAFT_660944 [Colletotrichum falcatum]
MERTDKRDPERGVASRQGSLVALLHRPQSGSPPSHHSHLFGSRPPLVQRRPKLVPSTCPVTCAVQCSVQCSAVQLGWALNSPWHGIRR